MANSWGAFNPNNLGGKTLDSLRNDIYAGFRTKSVSVRGRRTKYGYGPSSTKQVFNAGYYKDHPGWGAIGDKLGININSQNDVRQLFDYVSGYKPPAPAAPKAAPAPVKATPVQISKASKDFRKESQALLDQANAAQAKFAIDQANAAKAAEAQRARDEAARVQREKIATQTAAARSGNERIAARSANLQIQPASTTPQTAGTQPFKRRKLQFNAPTYGGVASVKSGILNI